MPAADPTRIALVAAVSLVGALSNSISMASFTQWRCILIRLGVGIDYSLFILILTRTRTGLRQGLSTQDAVINASATAGRAVLFAAITACIVLCGMFIVRVSVLSGAAIAAPISVLFPMAAAQTLLPALNGLLGRRVLTRKRRNALDAGANGLRGSTAPSGARTRMSAVRRSRRRQLFAAGVPLRHDANRCASNRKCVTRPFPH